MILVKMQTESGQYSHVHLGRLIIIMEICKAPTLRLEALNKHTHIMYIEMENAIKKEEEDIDKGF